MIEKAVSIISNLFTIAASGIAVYIFIAKRSEFRALLRTITNFANQSSLAEVRQKLEELNNLNAINIEESIEIVNIFHDICGQIDGNPLLKGRFADFSVRVRRSTNGRRPVTEPQKRALVSELREGLRHLDITNYADAMGDFKR